VLFGIGIYNYYAAVVPEQYPLVKPLMLFFPAGDKAKGLSQLRKASEAAQYANVEASYFLLQTLYNYEGRAEEALPIAERLFTTYPRNAVFHRLVGRCQASLNRTADAESTWTEAIRRVNSGGTGYTAAVEREARYYLGVSAMLERRTEAALEQLYRCDELSRTLDTDGASGFMVLANLKIGMLYDLQAKRALAVEQYNKVLKMNDFQKSHDQARMYLKSPFRS
jgi:tetratricopeptide (TPR) repeat protein